MTSKDYSKFLILTNIIQDNCILTNNINKEVFAIIEELNKASFGSKEQPDSIDCFIENTKKQIPSNNFISMIICSKVLKHQVRKFSYKAKKDSKGKNKIAYYFNIVADFGIKTAKENLNISINKEEYDKLNNYLNKNII
jgi:hypothetical protein